MRKVRRSKSHRRLALTLTLVLLAVLIAMALKPVNHDRVPYRIYEYLHEIGFAVLVLPAAVFHPVSLFWMVPVLAVLGVLIEAVQPYFGRGAELHDIGSNLAGMVIGISFGLLVRYLRSAMR